MATSTRTRQRDQHDPGPVLEVRKPATGAVVETVPKLDADLPPLPRLARPGLPAVPTPSRVVRGLRRVLRGGG